MARMQISMWEEFGHDMLLVENGTAALAQALGCGVIYRKKGAPVAHTTAIKRLEDLRNLETVSYTHLNTDSLTWTKAEESKWM